MEPDVPRGVAHRARLSLRSASSRIGHPRRREEIRSLSEGCGRTWGPELSVRRNAWRDHHRPHVHRWWRRSQPREVKGGLLGADYKIENGRYRFARVYNGENWNPDLRAPLTQPGVDVKAGEYLLEVEGRSVEPPAEVYSFFENTAGKQIKIKVGPNADGKDAREVTVVPLPSEFALRNRAWEEDSRRKVDELSGGKLAYVHVPATPVGGWLNFNRFYFAQVRKDRKSVVQGKSVDLGGRRIIKKKKHPNVR